MTDQRYMEIVKALAYGESPAQIAVAENVQQAEVERIAAQDAEKVSLRREQLKEAGYL